MAGARHRMASSSRERRSVRPRGPLAADRRQHPGHPHRRLRRGGWQERRGLSFGDPTDYDALWRWSVEHLDQFWGDFATWSGVLPDVPDDRVLTDRSMPGAVWFPGTTINFAEQAFRNAPDDSPAIIEVAEDARAGRDLVGVAARPGGCVRRDAPPAGRAARRPGGRLPAQRARGGRRLPRRRVDRRGVVLVRAGLRHPRRPRPVRPDRADGAGRRRRLPLQRQGLRPPGRRRRAAGGAAERADDGRRPPAVPGRTARRCPGLGRGGRRRAGARSSRRCRSTTRCGSSTPRARRGCRRASCTGTAASSSSSASRLRCTWTSAPATGSSGTPRPPGSCGTSPRRRCSPARRWWSTTARPPIRRSTPCSGSRRRRASRSSARARAISGPARRPASGRASGTTSPRSG